MSAILNASLGRNPGNKKSGKRVVNGNLLVTHLFSCLCTPCLLKLLHIYSVSRLHDWMDLPAKPARTTLLI